MSVNVLEGGGKGGVSERPPLGERRSPISRGSRVSRVVVLETGVVKQKT